MVIMMVSKFKFSLLFSRNLQCYLEHSTYAYLNNVVAQHTCSLGLHGESHSYQKDTDWVM